MIDLSLTDEQREIVGSAEALLREQCPVSRLRPGQKPVDVHALLTDFGWFGLGLTEALGGSGLGIAEEALLFMEAGRFLLSPSILATTLAAKFADADLRAALLGGTARAAFVIAGPDGRAYCFDRVDAELLVAIGTSGISLYPASAFSGEAIAGIDETVVTERGRLGTGTQVALADHAILLVAAMLAGMANAASALAVEYAKIREQFGQPIGAFQAVKHRCADMAIKAYAAEAQILMAAASAVDDARNAPFQIAAAARTAIAAARDNGASAIQVHGGMGFTVECGAHLYLKRTHVLSQLIGGRELQQERLLACASTARGE